LQGMVKGIQKARKELFRALEKVDGKAAGLARFIEINPEIFFAGFNNESEIDMLKFLLSESIKNTQALLDKIQEHEDKAGFPVIRKY